MAALVGVGVNKRQAALGMFDIAGERRQQTIRIATGRFDFNYVGAEVGEPARRVGCVEYRRSSTTRRWPKADSSMFVSAK